MLNAERVRKHQITKDEIEISLWVHYHIWVQNSIPIPCSCPAAFLRMDSWGLEGSLSSCLSSLPPSRCTHTCLEEGKRSCLHLCSLLSSAVPLVFVFLLQCHRDDNVCSLAYSLDHFAGVNLSWVDLVLKPAIMAIASRSWQRKQPTWEVWESFLEAQSTACFFSLYNNFVSTHFSYKFSF